MSDIEMAVKRSKILEGRLRRELKAKGNGLYELANSVKGKLPPETYENLCKISEKRNEIVHEENRDDLEDRQAFVRLCDRAESELDRFKAGEEILGFVVAFAIMVIAIIIYLLTRYPL